MYSCKVYQIIVVYYSIHLDFENSCICPNCIITPPNIKIISDCTTETSLMLTFTSMLVKYVVLGAGSSDNNNSPLAVCERDEIIFELQHQ